VLSTGRRDGVRRYAACVILATTRADVNNVARRELDVRKASFAAMDTAVEQTGMEHGGITPVGLPTAWPVLVDALVADTPSVVIGSGVRRSKLVLPGKLLASLPRPKGIEGLGRRGAAQGATTAQGRLKVLGAGGRDRQQPQRGAGSCYGTGATSPGAGRVR